MLAPFADSVSERFIEWLRAKDAAIPQPSTINHQPAEPGALAFNSDQLSWLRLIRDHIATSVRVEIYDQPYNLRGTDPDYIFKLADYVDVKMRTVAEQTSTVDSLRLAVLAALNIADEYHLLKRKYDAIASEYNQRAHQLSGKLDEVLKETARKAG